MTAPNPYTPPNSAVDDVENPDTNVPRKRVWLFTFTGAIAGALLGGVFQWVFFQPGRSLGSSGQAQLPLDVGNIAAWATINGLIFLTHGAVLGAMLDTWIEQTKR